MSSTIRRRPCLDCGQLATATRCTACARAWNCRRDTLRGTATQRGYGAAWRTLAGAVLRRDRGRCHWCGAIATTVDHVIPKRLGGTDDLANLVAACTRCNYGRTARIGHQRLRRPST